jgi:hypothetical protein
MIRRCTSFANIVLEIFHITGVNDATHLSCGVIAGGALRIAGRFESFDEAAAA